MKRLAPKISVCMPVYNGSAQIAEAIESILNQTYRDFRLIIIDNCSTDDTAGIVRKFDDKRIDFLCNPRNLGLIGNVNRCLEMADGQYVCIFAHDDVMLPDNLERKARLLDEHPDVGFVHSDILIVDTEGKTVGDHIWYKDSTTDYIEDGAVVLRKYLDYLPWGAGIFIGSVLARKASFEHVGNYDTQLPHCGDSEILMRMMLFFRVACIGSRLVKYRVHPASESNCFGFSCDSMNFIREHFRAAEIFFENYGKYIPDVVACEKRLKSAFANRALFLALNAFSEGNHGDGWKFVKEATRFRPGVVRSGSFWKTVAHSAAGPKGIRLFRRIRAHRVPCN